MKAKKIVYKSYMVNDDVICAGHSCIQADTQEQATQIAYERCVKYGYKNIHIKPNGNVHYSGGYSL